MVVPLAGLTRLGPPATFVVLYHQLLALCVELLIAYGAGIALALEFGVAAVGLLEAYLVLSKIYSSFAPTTQAILWQSASKVSKIC